MSLHPDAPGDVLADPEKYARWRSGHLDAHDRTMARQMSLDDLLDYFRAEWHGTAEDFKPQFSYRKSSFGANVMRRMIGRRF